MFLLASRRGSAAPESGAVAPLDLGGSVTDVCALTTAGGDLAVTPGQRVGVVGRTGAGKSSLVAALLRLVGVDGGRVLLGGADTAALGVDELRRRVAVCPQDCALFRGSLRENVDPTGAHGDAAVHRVAAPRHRGLAGTSVGLVRSRHRLSTG